MSCIPIQDDRGGGTRLRNRVGDAAGGGGGAQTTEVFANTNIYSRSKASN